MYYENHDPDFVIAFSLSVCAQEINYCHDNESEKNGMRLL